MDALQNTSEKYDMRINTKKTKKKPKVIRKLGGRKTYKDQR